MYGQLTKLSRRGKNIGQTLKKEHINNKRYATAEKMLTHFNSRLTNLEKLCKDTNANVLMCNLIISDLEEMLDQIEKNINPNAQNKI